MELQKCNFFFQCNKTLLGPEAASFRQQREQRQEAKRQDEREQAENIRPEVLCLEIISPKYHVSRFRTRHVASRARYALDLRPLVDEECFIAVTKPG